MIKEIEIQGCITVPEEVSADEVIDKFIAFVEKMSGVLAVGIGRLSTDTT